jgi:methylmalonyl-CoA mutase
MTIENMKKTSFKNHTLDDWQEMATSSLKGKPIESLYTRTYENILLKPLYTKEDLHEEDHNFFPGHQDNRRGIDRVSEHSTSWHIANKLSYKSLHDLEKKLKLALSKGQTAVAFIVKPETFEDNTTLISLLQNLGTNHPFCIDAGLLQEPMLAVMRKSYKNSGISVSGFVAADPIAEASMSGNLPEDEKEFYKNWSDMLEEADADMPDLKTVLVNTAPYHNSGAHAVQELAIAISTGVHLLQRLLENGWELEKALSKMVFHFAVGANFFMEAAKLRAARLLWSKVAEAFGADPEDRKMVISAETSAFTKTIFDPYVNMLRTGNEAFAAVLGGIQYLHADTFDDVSGKTDPFSERIARNTQLILKNEVHLEKVVDPAGGSWYIESLTRQLAEKSWEFFLQIDSSDGIVEVLKSGWLQTQISEVAAKRKSDILMRKRSVIGTNVYANLAEHPVEPVDIDLQTGKMFAPLKQKRLAEPYEKLRFWAERIAKNFGVNPNIGLICLGEFKNHRPRADFISGLLAAGGMHSLQSGTIADFQGAVEFVNAQSCHQFVICGANEDYAEFGPALAKEIKNQRAGVSLYLAGMPAEKEAVEWQVAGIEAFIHARTDAVQVLSTLLQEMEDLR